MRPGIPVDCELTGAPSLGRSAQVLVIQAHPAIHHLLFVHIQTEEKLKGHIHVGSTDLLQQKVNFLCWRFLISFVAFLGFETKPMAFSISCEVTYFITIHYVT